MTSIARTRRRSASLLAITALLLALALSSCAGRGVARGNATTGGSGYTSTQTTSGSGGNTALDADISALSSIDSQIQAALGSADDAQNAATQDQSSQDSAVTP
jgi:hypothetical protein